MSQKAIPRVREFVISQVVKTGNTPRAAELEGLLGGIDLPRNSRRKQRHQAG